MKIEVLESKLLPAFESMLWKGGKNHPEKLEMVEALTTAIETLKRIDVNGLQSILFPTGEPNPNAWEKLTEKEAQTIYNYLTEKK